jgi:hypothetical protein
MRKCEKKGINMKNTKDRRTEECRKKILFWMGGGGAEKCGSGPNYRHLTIFLYFYKSFLN